MSDDGCTAKKGCLHNNVMCGFPLCAWGKACMKTPDAEGLPAPPPHHSIEGDGEMSDASTTVTEAAIIDLQRQREAFMARAKNFDPAAAAGEPGDVRLSAEAVDAICAPVRLEITFADPIHTRQQIEALQAALVEALVVTQDHQRGINRQRMDLRHVIKSAAEVLVYMNGRTPTGKKRINPHSTS